MSNLKNIVPPVELCKQIPAGEFGDSALTWYNFRGIPILRWRDNLEKLTGVRPIPAPTLEEVLEAIGEVENWDTATITRPIGVNARIVDTALKRWFKVKGIEVE